MISRSQQTNTTNILKLQLEPHDEKPPLTNSGEHVIQKESVTQEKVYFWTAAISQVQLEWDNAK